MTYTVRAKRWEHGWELHIDGEGVTQSRSLSTADRTVREYLSLLHDRDITDEITIVHDLGSKIDAEVRKARRAVAELAERQRQVAALSRSTADELRKAGLAGAEIAKVLGVSAQRVSQLTRPTAKAPRTARTRAAAKSAAATPRAVAKSTTKSERAKSGQRSGGGRKA